MKNVRRCKGWNK